nr:hypothetical protein [Roseinatronobacter thiooxidans]
MGLRTALYQAETIIWDRACPSWLTASALNVATARGKKRATVALAHHIGVVLHRMWRDSTEFRFTRAGAMSTPAMEQKQHHSSPQAADCRGKALRSG